MQSNGVVSAPVVVALRRLSELGGMVSDQVFYHEVILRCGLGHTDYGAWMARADRRSFVRWANRDVSIGTRGWELLGREVPEEFAERVRRRTAKEEDGLMGDYPG